MSLHDPVVPRSESPVAPAPAGRSDYPGPAAEPPPPQPAGPAPANADLAEAPTDWGTGCPFGEPTEPTEPTAARRDGYRRRPRPGKRLVPPSAPVADFTPEQRLLLLDTWQRSQLPAADFAALVGISKHTLYAWKKKFDTQGPGGLMDQPHGSKPGSRLPELTKRTILLLKQTNPDWGCQKISDLLLRGPALPASPTAVARVLHEAGYELEEVATRPHPGHVRHFERARPNQLWQTDLFTFVLDYPS